MTANHAPDSPSGSGFLLSDSTIDPSFSITSDAGVFCARVPLTKLAEDVNVLAKGNLAATDSDSNLCPLGPPGSAVAPLSVLDWASSAVLKLVKKPTATSKSPCTLMKLAPGGGKIKLTEPLASSSSAKPVSSFQIRSPSASRPKVARCLHSSASSALYSDDVDDDGALVVLSNCKDSAGKASL